MPQIDLEFPAPTHSAAFAASDPDARTIAGLAVPLGVPSGPAMDGHRYRFTSPPANAADLVDVVAEHDDAALVGRLARPLDVTDAGLEATARIFATTRGNDTLVEASEGARTGFSISAAFAEYATDPDGIRDVTDWTVRHVGIVRRPAFAESAGLTINASAHTPTEGDTPMTDTTATAGAAAGAAAAGGPNVEQLPNTEQPTVAELAALVADHLKPADPATHPLARFASFTQFCEAFKDEGDDDKRAAMVAAFAVPDQVTPDNPGVMPPAWRTGIKANLDKRRPAIRATGSIGLPPAGMDANWPYFDGDLDSIITEQTAEKTALSGVSISIKKGSAALHTAGTVSDISYQLLMRSSPSYLAAYLQICLAAWARYTEAVYEGALVAGGTAAGTLDVSSAAKARATLFAASSDVEDATGAPADTVLVDPATFVALGQLDGLYNPKYGTQNAAGTASAATLHIDVNGLTVTRAPFLDASTMVVTNSEAAKFAESGARVATEEDVTKLGRNVAVWGMYEEAEIYFPAGVRVYAPAAG